MIDVSKEFKESIKARNREIKGCVKALYRGSEINVRNNLVGITGEKETSITNSDSVFSSDPCFINYATLEPQRFLLDGSFILPNDPTRNNNYALVFGNNHLEISYSLDIKDGLILLFDIEFTDYKQSIFFTASGDNYSFEVGMNTDGSLYSKSTVNGEEKIQSGEPQILRLNTRYRAYASVYPTTENSIFTVNVGGISQPVCINNNYTGNINNIIFGNDASDNFNISELAVYDVVDSRYYGVANMIYQEYLRAGIVMTENLISHYLFQTESNEIKDIVNGRNAIVVGNLNYKFVPFVNPNAGYIGGFDTDSVVIKQKLTASDDIGIFSNNGVFGCTIYFQDGYAQNFDVVIKHVKYGLEDYYDETIKVRNNTETICNIQFEDIRDGYDYIAEMTIDVLSWSNDHRIKIYKIDNGFTYLYEGRRLIDFSVTEQVDNISLEMPNNTFSMNLNNYDGMFDEINPNSLLKLLDKNTKFLPYISLKNCADEFVPLGVFNYSSYTSNDSTVGLKADGPLNSSQYTVVNNGNYDAKDLLQDLTRMSLSFAQSKCNLLYDGTVNNSYSNFKKNTEQIQSLEIFCNSMVYPERKYTPKLGQGPVSVNYIVTEVYDTLYLNCQKNYPKMTNRNLVKEVVFENTTMSNKKTEQEEVFKDTISGKKVTVYTSSGEEYRYEYNVDISYSRPTDFNSLQISIDGAVISESNLSLIEKNYYRLKFTYFSSTKDSIELVVKGYTYEETTTKTVISNPLVAEGDSISISNPYIRTLTDMNRVAKFIFDYYGSYVADIEYNGNPSYQIADIIQLETRYGFKNIMIIEQTLKFDGGLSGSLKGVTLND